MLFTIEITKADSFGWNYKVIKGEFGINLKAQWASTYKAAKRKAERDAREWEQSILNEQATERYAYDASKR